MEPLAILHADHLDLLFENRNKLYGAYTLRKNYNKRLLISMAVIFSAVSLSTIIYLYLQSSGLTVKTFNIPDIDPIAYPIEKPIHPPTVIRQPSTIHHPPSATLQYVKPLIVPDNKVTEPIVTVNKLDASAIGIKTTIGAPDNGSPAGNGNATNGSAVLKADSADAKPDILYRAEVMPEFPGGIEALKRFLLKNLRMPENDMDPGSEVHVIARFVVGSDGRVRDVEITRPADAIFNAEVKRVIAKMPDWKPGMQNHRPVSVYFSLPVNFVRGE
jgi:periplasmic protein TonB